MIEKLNIKKEDSILVGVISNDRLESYTPWYHKSLKKIIMLLVFLTNMVIMII